MNKLFQLLFNLPFTLYNYLLSDIQYARKLKVKVGEGCKIATRYWGSEPFLIEIGDHVHVTAGVRFITHDGGVWVFRKDFPDFDVFGKIKIGNNTYIGNNVSILPGVSIGNNCVIGLNSIITKSIPDNCVVAGNPARYICSTSEYLTKMEPHNMRVKGLSPLQKELAILNILEKNIVPGLKKPLLKI